MPAARSGGYRAWVAGGVGYLLLMGAVLAGGFFARNWAIDTYGSPQAQAQWDQWRAEAAKLANEGPVKRRVPKSDKPPALILATTYFGVCLTIALVLTTVLFWTATYFAVGVIHSPGRIRG